MEDIANMMALSPSDAWTLAIICFVAGIVRGFSGFALSALVMASAVLILPPIALIPICLVLEATASLLMIRGGMQNGDRGMVARLTAGVLVGTPVGLALTVMLPVEASKIAALCVILALAAAQLARLRIPFLATTAGTYSAGFIAGVATGLASVGGMVVALFVLAREGTAAAMRATLVLYLAVSLLVGLAWLLIFGVMTEIAFWRGLLMAAPAALGVLVGARLFTPRYQTYYRPFCLALLTGLAGFGLVRMSF